MIGCCPVIYPDNRWLGVQATTPPHAAHAAQLRDHALLTRLVALTEAGVCDMQPRELGSVAWALGRLGRRPRDLLYAVEGALRAREGHMARQHNSASS